MSNKHTVSEHYVTLVNALSVIASIRDHAVDAETRQRANDAGVALNALLSLQAKKQEVTVAHEQDQKPA